MAIASDSAPSAGATAGSAKNRPIAGASSQTDPARTAPAAADSVSATAT